jgi:3-methyladenine DNA glycosylase/8-oxoguanine DNA glycosylase
MRMRPSPGPTDENPRVLERRIRPARPIDLTSTLAPTRHGRSDPCTRVTTGEVWRATRTPHGPATIRVTDARDSIVVRAWGSGGAWALDHAPRLLGLHDDPAAFHPVDPLVRDLHRHRPGLRIGATDAVVEALVATIVEQRVTTVEAHRSYARLVRRYGDPAPGPAGRQGLRLPPHPERLARLPYWAFHPLGIERRRADAIRRVCARARTLERAATMESRDGQVLLRTVPGVGVWTAAEVAAVAFGDPDAVSVGDYGLPGLVGWALAGEREADDARMLELLEPFRGQRGRVIRLLSGAGLGPPRRFPRARLREIERM